MKPATLNITSSEVQAQAEFQPISQALLTGRVYATVVSKKSGEHITVQLKCRRKEAEAGKWVPCDLADATRVFADVPSTSDWQHGRGNDKIGTYYPPNPGVEKYAGLFWADRAADPARVWACLFVLRACAGRDISPQAELLEGVNCLACGRELSDPESIERNLGPECAGKETGSQHERKNQSAGGHEDRASAGPVAPREAVPADTSGVVPVEPPVAANGPEDASGGVWDAAAYHDALAARDAPVLDGLLVRVPGQSFRDIVPAS